jgi:hypothetical protein
MAGMLKHTLILPAGDSKLAARLLREALEDLPCSRPSASLSNMIWA